MSSDKYFEGAFKLRCKANSISWISRDKVTKGLDIFESYKIFVSKSTGSPKKDFKVIGKTYIGKPFTACTDSLIPIGFLKPNYKLKNLSKYMSTKFLRFMVQTLKSSQNVTQIVYGFVPMQDLNSNSDIDWSVSIP